MCEPHSLIHVLKTQSTSKIIQKLTPDKTISNLSQAISLVENYSPTDKTRYDSFHVPRQVNSGAHFAYNMPMKRDHYKLLILSKYAMNDLNLSMGEEFKEDTIKILSGNKVFYSESQNVFPYSLAYAGFQFGQFAGQLGDGRLVNLFDIKDKRNNWQTLQVKGSGLTAFSRFGDGKAVLRSSVREFIMSEALYHIGIPSTRAIQLTLLPGTKAMRNGKLEPCAVVCRFSPSWIRLGNFDLFRMRPNLPGLIQLTDFCIDEVFNKGGKFPTNIDINLFNKDYFPDSDVKISISPENEKINDISKYDLFYRHVVNLNAKTVAYWQSYGFLNGVLNTDNTSIMGLSIDFGPFNFLDRFEPDFTPNHDDSMKRYSFQNQPDVIWWNLAQMGQAISVLIGCNKNQLNDIISSGYEGMTQDVETKLVKRANSVLQHCSNEYKYRFTSQYAILMSKRLGIELNIDVETATTQHEINRISEVVQEFCDSIIEPLLKILQRTKIDYNNFFLNLQNHSSEIVILEDGSNDLNKLSQEYLSIFLTPTQLKHLNKMYKEGMRGHNQNGESRFLKEILEDIIEWTHSFSRLITNNEERISLAKKHNPLFIPRSWILDEVIEDLTVRQKDQLADPNAQLDTSLLDKLLTMSTFPYDSSKWDHSLLQEKEIEWTNLSHSPEIMAKSMKQSTCSS